MRELLRIPRFKYLVVAAACLGVATVSDGFLYLTLQHRLTFAASFIPLLYVATSGVYFLLALPAGRLADQFGRGRVFVAGYGLLLGVYAILLLPQGLGTEALALCILLFGAYYAATDGVLMDAVRTRDRRLGVRECAGPRGSAHPFRALENPCLVNVNPNDPRLTGDLLSSAAWWSPASSCSSATPCARYRRRPLARRPLRTRQRSRTSWPKS
jgi:hypothetical protein